MNARDQRGREMKRTRTRVKVKSINIVFDIVNGKLSITEAMHRA